MQTMPSATRPRAHTIPPCTTMTIAKAITGSAWTTLPATVVALGGVDDLRPAPVVERHEQGHAVVPRGLRLGPVHPLEEPVRDPPAPADEAHAHALLVELGRLGLDQVGEHDHQAIHL